MRLYVAGPMRGIPEFNFPAFDEATRVLRRMGHEVFNPAQHDREIKGFDPIGMTGKEDLSAHGFNLREALAIDLAFICQDADAVVGLFGWHHSLGARAEIATARAIGLPVFRLETTGRLLDGQVVKVDPHLVEVRNFDV